MNPGRPRGPAGALAAGALLGTAGAALGALVAQVPGAAVGAALGAAAAAGWHHRRERRARARRQLLASPFPAEWRAFLLGRYDHYQRLPPEWRRRFEDDVRLFVAETRITGVDVTLDDELRVLVAASAITLSVGWSEYEWSHLAEVLLYPHDFDRDYQWGEKPQLSGLAHNWGTLILSLPSLRHSFANPDDGYHVGLHEFAHLIDIEHSAFDGIPAGLSEAETRRWIPVAEAELERVRHGRSALDPYAGESPAELFAVSVEAFFEIPLVVRGRHPELYALLAAYFAQDPAAWEEQRRYGSAPV